MQNKKTGYLDKIAYIWRQEYKMIFTDFAAIFTFFIIPIMVSTLYTYVYSNQILTNLPIAVVDEDFSPESRQLTRMIDQTEEVNTDYKTASFSEAKTWFKDHKVRGIVLIPKAFSKDLFRHKSPTVSVYCDASYMLYYRQVLRAVTLATTYMNKGIELKTLNAQGKTSAQAMQESIPVKGVAMSMYNTNSGYATFIMPAVYIIIIQYILLSGIGLLGGTRRESSRQKDSRLHIHHLSDAIAILTARVDAYASIALLVFLLVFGIILPLFALPQRGALLDVFIWMLPFVMAVSFMGIALSTFFRYREDAVMVIMMSSIPILLVSGIDWPLSDMPIWLQALASILPSTITTKGFIAISQSGSPLIEMSREWFQLWGLTAFYALLALLSLWPRKHKKQLAE